VAHKTGALASRDLERVVVDTTVQPKAIAHPTDARLCHRALEKLVDLAKRNHVPLRQSYVRLAKRAAIMVRALYPRPSVQAGAPATSQLRMHSISNVDRCPGGSGSATACDQASANQSVQLQHLPGEHAFPAHLRALPCNIRRGSPWMG
jgi:hypothetical protein